MFSICTSRNCKGTLWGFSNSKEMQMHKSNENILPLSCWLTVVGSNVQRYLETWQKAVRKKSACRWKKKYSPSESLLSATEYKVHKVCVLLYDSTAPWDLTPLICLTVRCEFVCCLLSAQWIWVTAIWYWVRIVKTALWFAGSKIQAEENKASRYFWHTAHSWRRAFRLFQFFETKVGWGTCQ